VGDEVAIVSWVLPAPIDAEIVAAAAEIELIANEVEHIVYVIDFHIVTTCWVSALLFTL
jgi:hypothetical protein